MPTSSNRLVLTKRMGDTTLLASPRTFNSSLEAQEEALAIVGHGRIETKGNEITVHQYLKEPIVFRLTSAADFL